MTDRDPRAPRRLKAAFSSLLHFGWSRPLPLILQTEAAECGLACLTMVACYYGHRVDLASLRRRYSTSLKGIDLQRMVAIAASLGMHSRPLQLELEELGQLRCPCLLHWNHDHFVVLKKVSARSVAIHDPARGVQQLSHKDVSRHFTGVALELSRAADFKPIEEKQSVSLRSLTGAVHGVIPALLQILGLALVLEVFALIGPFYVQWVLDQVLVSADHDLLTLLGLGFLAVVLLQTLIAMARSWAMIWLGATVGVQWASHLVGHLLRLPLQWFEKRHVGDVVSRLGSIQTIQSTLTDQVIGTLLDGVMSVITLLVMSFYSAPLTLLVLGLFVTYGLLRWAFYQPLRRASEDQLVFASRQQSELLESIRGALPIKLANKQEQRQVRYVNASVQTTNLGIRIRRLGITFSGLNQLIFGFGRVSLIWIAAALALKGTFSAGMLIAFIAYADQFTARATGLIDKWVDFRMLKLHTERLADIALSAPEALDPEASAQGASEGPLPDGDIEFHKVSFRYAEGEPWVLKGCSFTIKAGESVAIVGPSGGGKSTLAKLLLGLLEPNEGSVTHAGIPIRCLGIQRYRSVIGAVMQDDLLFAGSIAENISFFDTRATSESIELAARLAAIHDDILAMPMGYHSLVGDMGSSLSGGQKQRVILARALYREPRLLILDEATSHLDTTCEHQVNMAIRRLVMTRIVIAHRTETIASADRVLLLSHGVISEPPLQRPAVMTTDRAPTPDGSPAIY